jgi:hypothetical protein
LGLTGVVGNVGDDAASAGATDNATSAAVAGRARTIGLRLRIGSSSGEPEPAGPASHRT